jgi:hypothetical protein
MNRLIRILVAAAAILALAIATSASARPDVGHAAGTIASESVVMTGLDNPRGLAFGPEGALYVAEAGRGGSGPCQTLRGATQCYGQSGAVTRLWRGQQERVATGFPSMVSPFGDAWGAHDISFQGRGGAYITTGFGANPTLRPGFGEAGMGFGRLIKMNASGDWNFVADLSAHEIATNPDGGLVESNPYGVLAEPGGQIVAEAAANALLRIRANGEISTLATFPSRAQGRLTPNGFLTDAVPTAVVVGPDGAYYVPELTGQPFETGAARIYRFAPGEAAQVFLDGFKTVLDIDFGPDGSLYVIQHATGPGITPNSGVLIRVAPDGTRTTVRADLNRPTSVLVGADGALYVTDNGTSIGMGQVLRIQP